jgi:uncharacterized membrane protein HdeD (DUF308 family)
MLEHYRDNWWIVVARGALCVGAGVVALLWPAAAMLAIVALFGLFAFVNGLFGLAGALRYHGDRGHGGILVLQGVLGVVAGTMAFMFPGAALYVLVLAAAGWAVATGALELITAVRLRRELRGEWMLALTGVLSIAFGVALLIQPLTGAITLLWLFMGYSIASGLLLVVMGLSARFWHGHDDLEPRQSRPSYA